METDDPALGLSAVESALPPSRGVCSLAWLSLPVISVLCCFSYRPPLQSITALSQTILSKLCLHIVIQP